MISNFFKSALRNILRQKSYTLINVINLAIGMACFVLILLWVHSEVSINRYFKKADQIYMVHKKVPTGNGYSINQELPFPFATAMKNEIPEIEAITRIDKWPTLVHYGDLFFDEYDLVGVDTSFFKVFDYEFIHGDAESSLSENKNIVITASIAKKYFGDEHPINKSLNLENGGQYRVSAVVKDPLGENKIESNMFIPIDPLYKNSEDYNDWFSHFLHCYIYAPSITNVDSLNSKVTRVMLKHTVDPESTNTRLTEIEHLAFSDLHLYNVEKKNQRIQYVYIFSLIGILILIVSCINYMNIATSISVRRSREIGLKKVVGAVRSQLTMQFIAEALIQAFLAMIIAMMLVELLRPFFNQLSGKSIEIPYLTYWFLPVLLGLIVLSSLLAGSYPAFLMSSFKPVEAFKGSMNSGKGQNQFRKILVIFQFSISIALIIATLFIYLQLSFINKKDLGFEKDNILYAYLNDDIINKYDSFRNELLANPNVVSICRSSQLPNFISYGMRGIEWVGKDDGELASFNFASVDYDFFETTGIKFKDGRAFSREYGTDSLHYIMNEAAIKMIGYENPVGKQFRSEDENGRILGVVYDFHSKPLTKGISPTFFIMEPEYYVYAMFKINPANKEETISFIENKWNEYAPLYPFNTRFFQGRIEREYRNEIKNSKLALAFTIIVIIITCIGLFGLASHTAQKKTKEIGVRKVFGASVKSLVFRFVKIFSIWVLIANLIAWPLAYYFVSEWLLNFAYGISISAWVFIIAAVVAMAIAILTVSYQSFKAANRNPIDSLRFE